MLVITDITYSPSTVDKAGYIGVSFTWGATDSSSFIAFQSNIGSTGDSHFCHLPMFDINDVIGAIGSMRVNAVSLMYSNDAPLNDRGGQIAANQFAAETSWHEIAVGGAAAVFKANGGSTAINCDKGIYAWMRPAFAEDFEWNKDIKNEKGLTLDSAFEIVAGNDFLCIYISIQNVPGRVGYFSVGHGCEVQTQSSALIVNKERADLRVFDAAMEDLKNLEQYHENPTHLEDLWESIKSGARAIINGVTTYGPGIIKGAQTIGTLL